MSSTTRSRAAANAIAKKNYTTIASTVKSINNTTSTIITRSTYTISKPTITSATISTNKVERIVKSNPPSTVANNNNEENQHSHKVKKSQTYHATKDDFADPRARHRITEAKGRAKRIQLYKDLNTLIRKIEAKIGEVIPMPMILADDINDTRRKISKSKFKYNNEEILRKIHVILYLSKVASASTATIPDSTSIVTTIHTTRTFRTTRTRYSVKDTSNLKPEEIVAVEPMEVEGDSDQQLPSNEMDRKKLNLSTLAIVAAAKSTCENVKTLFKTLIGEDAGQQQKSSNEKEKEIQELSTLATAVMI